MPQTNDLDAKIQAEAVTLADLLQRIDELDDVFDLWWANNVCSDGSPAITDGDLGDAVKAVKQAERKLRTEMAKTWLEVKHGKD